MKELGELHSSDGRNLIARVKANMAAAQDLIAQGDQEPDEVRQTELYTQALKLDPGLALRLLEQEPDLSETDPPSDH